MSSMKENVDKKICIYVRSRLEMVKPESAQGLFNQRCFMNAVQYCADNPGHEVYEVACIDNGHPFLHYINRETSTGKYLETTLGWQADHQEYYIIRMVHQDDHKKISEEFSRSLDSWKFQFTNWFQRLFIDRVM